MKRIEFVGAKRGRRLAQTGAMALLVALISITRLCRFSLWWRLAAEGGHRAGARRDHYAGILSLFHIES